MGHIVASGNLKGGVGKTTIAVNLACALEGRGRKVVLLDADPQASAVAWASLGRLPVRIEAQASLARGSGGPWLRLAGELARSGHLVLLDLPPGSAPTLASALFIADLLLAPLAPSAADARSTAEALRLLRSARESRRDGRPKGLLVPNRVDDPARYNEATRRAMADLREAWASPIGYHADHVNALSLGMWVGDYAPNSPAAEEIMTLAEEVEQALEGRGEPPAGPGGARSPGAAGGTPGPRRTGSGPFGKCSSGLANGGPVLREARPANPS